ncbi:PREDICTED: uncharacterized protein LOC109353999 [Lupinus angustifolius]|uniref:uncharacterized protein LOC109353999 n=1 Tax=Lupinus angustifolius TaxID=3871 RepID=UPI00092EFA1B|nr:PREDICTED: uncharacterized protein LOC109353999 [Lupinus angustifolius]
MLECNTTTTPVEVGNTVCKGSLGEETVDPTLFRQIIGSLRYVCNSRPYIAYRVGVISRHMEDPRASHMQAAKKLLRYLKGSLDYGVHFPKAGQMKQKEIYGYTNVDWCGDKDDRKSATGYFFKFESASISWSSKKQEVVALSSCEAEYIDVCLGACQGL